MTSDNNKRYTEWVNEITTRLVELREWRHRLERETQALNEDTRIVVREAHDARLTGQQIADLLGIDRTTLYKRKWF